MSQFYGGVQGHRGEATRMGSKDSGMHAYAQGYGSRISAEFHYNRSEDCDAASVTFSGGWTSYYRSRTIAFSDIDLVMQALDSGDPQIERIWQKIRSEFDKLESAAPKAIKRAHNRAERERRKEERERRERNARLKALKESLTDRERHFFVSLVLEMDEDERMEFFPTDEKIDERFISMYEAKQGMEPRRINGNMHVYQRKGGTWGRLECFDITAGKQVEINEEMLTT